MIRNLLLTGGPGPDHDFDELARTIADVVSGDTTVDENASAGRVQHGPQIESTIVHDPVEAFALLHDDGPSGEPFSLLTVNALRWSMNADRYAAQRDAFGFALGADDLDGVAALLARGGGVLAVHTAAICFDANERWHRMLGASWNWDRSSHPPCCALDVRVTPAGSHHILTRSVRPFPLHDEVYAHLDTESDVVPLLVASTAGSADVSDAPVFWARHYGGGRVVTDLLGHNVSSLRQPQHRALLRNAALWAALGAVALDGDRCERSTNGTQA